MADAEAWFVDSDREALDDFWLVYDRHFTTISGSPQSEFTRQLLAQAPEHVRHAALQRTILEGQWGEHDARLRGAAAHAFRVGTSFAAWHALYADFSRVVVPLMVETFHSEPSRLAAAMVVMQAYVMRSIQVVGEEYIAVQTRVLEENEKRYHLLFDHSPLPMWVYDPKTLGFIAVNDAAVRHYGYSREEFSLMTLVDLRPSEDEAALRAHVAQRENRQLERIWRHRKKNGELIQVEIWADDFALDHIALRLIVALDITERKQLEEQFRQAQKMDAVGKLAGGIAHDFNNLLSVILSYSSLGADSLPPDNPLRADLQEIQKAGTRAAELTGQLLAFSRQQMLQPRVLDINVVLDELRKMLERVIGENIELTTRLAADVDLVRADPGQIEQVLMNLVINARDAMPTGGRIVIETSNVELDDAYVSTHLGAVAGRQVMLAVSDTGSGMDKATQARIFEPFFTTKEKGKGTGLGLATVFGIVKQSGGSIYVYSEVNRGSTFKIYFPRATGVLDTPLPAREPARGGSETILLVEDEEPVRRLARDILGRAGYQVIEAHDAREAALLCMASREPIHLLLTDVMMPMMSGREVAEQVQRARPTIKVLYMSGYTADAIVHHGELDDGVHLLQKPITPDALLRRVREIIDG